MTRLPKTKRRRRKQERSQAGGRRGNLLGKEQMGGIIWRGFQLSLKGVSRASSRWREKEKVLSFFPLLREMNEAGSELQPCK